MAGTRCFERYDMIAPKTVLTRRDVLHITLQCAVTVPTSMLVTFPEEWLHPPPPTPYTLPPTQHTPTIPKVLIAWVLRPSFPVMTDPVFWRSNLGQEACILWTRSCSSVSGAHLLSSTKRRQQSDIIDGWESGLLIITIFLSLSL